MMFAEDFPACSPPCRRLQTLKALKAFFQGEAG
jgi:hypothetical protein